MHVSDDDCCVHDSDSLSLTLDSASSPRPTGTKQQGASGQSVAARQPWATTGGGDWSAQPASVGRLAVWPWLHSAASPLLYVCGGYF